MGRGKEPATLKKATVAVLGGKARAYSCRQQTASHITKSRPITVSGASDAVCCNSRRARLGLSDSEAGGGENKARKGQ